MKPLNGQSKVLVTGGTGFVGQSLLRWLLTSPNRPALTLLSRSPEAFQARFPELVQGVQWLQGDVRDFEFPTEAFTHVLHGATETNMAAHARADEMTSTVLEGTRHVLAFAKQSGARLLHLSSGAAAGPQPSDLPRLPDDAAFPLPDAPSSAYARAKREAEALVADAGGVNARLFAFLGEALPLDAHFAIGNFIRDALAGRPIVIQGDGTPVRTYLDANDLSEWLFALLERGAPGSTVNVGGEEPIDIASLARLVAATVTPGLPVQVLGTPKPGVGGHRYVPDVSRAKALGLTVKVPLAASVARVAAWHRRAKAEPGAR